MARQPGADEQMLRERQAIIFDQLDMTSRNCRETQTAFRAFSQTRVGK